MATWYVNAQSGNDVNSGASEALAKKTIAATVAAAATGDTLYLTGSFYESSLTASKTLYVRGLKGCVWNGQIGLPAVTLPSGYAWSFYDIVFHKHAYAFYNMGGSANYPTFEGCVFRDCTTPIMAYAPTVRNCIFSRCLTSGIGQIGSGSLVLYAYDSLFVNCPIGIARYVNTSQYYLSNCAFVGCTTDFWTVSGGTNTYVDVKNCVTDFANGAKWVIGGSNYTSWATIAAIYPQVIGNFNEVLTSALEDYLNGAECASPNSPLLTVPGSLRGFIGARNMGTAISASRNSSLWTGGVFSDTELDVNSNLTLSAGKTTGTWSSDVLDYGYGVHLNSVFLSTLDEDVVNYVDSSAVDSPNYCTVELRGSDTPFVKTDVSPAWTAVPRHTQISDYMTARYRYWQIRLTLQGP